MNNDKSDIQGKGHGDAHDWKCVDTVYRATRYVCRRCGARFLHDYPRVPDIFQALAMAGVPAECVEPKPTESAP